MQTMKAMVVTGYGTPDVLQLQQLPTPEPQAHELLVRVLTSAATTADAMMRTGTPYFGRLFLGWSRPKRPIPGTGFAGIVEAVGSAVQDFQVGDCVFGETGFQFSANAEYLTIAEDGIVLPLPDHLEAAEAAGLCDGPLTSFNFLHELAHVQAGQRVLINGASGALGTAAVQLAVYWGAEVTAVCSASNAGLVRSLGATQVIDYQTQDFTASEERYDCIYDTVGKRSFRDCKRVLTPNGLYLSPVLEMPLLMAMLWTSIKGGQKAKFAATGVNTPSTIKTMLKQVLTIHQLGKLTTVIDRQFPLEKLAEAHRYIDTGRKKGNVVMHHA